MAVDARFVQIALVLGDSSRTGLRTDCGLRTDVNISEINQQVIVCAAGDNTIGWAPIPEHDQEMALMHQFVIPLEITGFVVETNDVVAFQIDFSVDGLVWKTYDQVGKGSTILISFERHIIWMFTLEQMHSNVW